MTAWIWVGRCTGAFGLGLVLGVLLDQTARSAVFPHWLAAVVFAASIGLLTATMRPFPGKTSLFVVSVIGATGFSAPAFSAPVAGWEMLIPVLLWLNLYVWAFALAIDVAKQRRWLRGTCLGAVIVVTTLAASVLTYAGSNETRWQLSRGEMTRIAREVTSGEVDASTVERVGLWKVMWAFRDGSNAWFETGDHCFLCTTGLLYSPSALPEDSCATFEHVEGPWYSYVEDC